MVDSRAVGRSSVTEGIIVRADGKVEDLGILSPDEKPFPLEFLTLRETIEYKESTQTEIDKVISEKEK